MGQAAYIYALVGNEGDATVLRYRTEIEAPLPGADVPTTPAVGPASVEGSTCRTKAAPTDCAFPVSCRTRL